jgi:hypothetical protein
MACYQGLHSLQGVRRKTPRYSYDEEIQGNTYIGEYDKPCGALYLAVRDCRYHDHDRASRVVHRVLLSA